MVRPPALLTDLAVGTDTRKYRRGKLDLSSEGISQPRREILVAPCSKGLGWKRSCCRKAVLVGDEWK